MGLPLLPALPRLKKNIYSLSGPKETLEVDNGQSFSEDGKEGTNGKKERQESDETQKHVRACSLKTYYQRLAPNEPHPCDRLGQGSSCPIEAEYLMGEGNYYCEKHFQASIQHCAQNGYVVIEGFPDKAEEVK